MVGLTVIKALFFMVLIFILLYSFFADFEGDSIQHKECESYKTLAKSPENLILIKMWFEKLKSDEELLKRLYYFSKHLSSKPDVLVDEFGWPFPNSIPISNFKIYGKNFEHETWNSNEIAGFRLGQNKRIGLYYIISPENMEFDIEELRGKVNIGSSNIFLKCQ